MAAFRPLKLESSWLDVRLSDVTAALAIACMVALSTTMADWSVPVAVYVRVAVPHGLPD